MQKTFSERCNLLLMMRMNVFQITDPYRPMYEIYARWSLKKIMKEAEINFYMINAYRWAIFFKDWNAMKNLDW